jgi:hypothetical protein
MDDVNKLPVLDTLPPTIPTPAIETPAVVTPTVAAPPIDPLYVSASVQSSDATLPVSIANSPLVPQATSSARDDSVPTVNHIESAAMEMDPSVHIANGEIITSSVIANGIPVPAPIAALARPETVQVVAVAEVPLATPVVVAPIAVLPPAPAVVYAPALSPYLPSPTTILPPPPHVEPVVLSRVDSSSSLIVEPPTPAASIPAPIPAPAPVVAALPLSPYYTPLPESISSQPSQPEAVAAPVSVAAQFSQESYIQHQPAPVQQQAQAIVQVDTAMQDGTSISPLNKRSAPEENEIIGSVSYSEAERDAKRARVESDEVGANS